jgi:hypothetical protein
VDQLLRKTSAKELPLRVVWDDKERVKGNSQLGERHRGESGATAVLLAKDPETVSVRSGYRAEIDGVGAVAVLAVVFLLKASQRWFHKP